MHSHMEGDISDLKALVEAEVSKSRQAEEQHKAAQADLAHQLDVASSQTRQLESSQAELLSQVCVRYLNHVCIFPSIGSLLFVLCFMTQSACFLTWPPAMHKAFEPRLVPFKSGLCKAHLCDLPRWQSARVLPQMCALLQAGLTRLCLALQALQAQLSRHHQQAQEAQAKAEHQALMLQERLAEAQGCGESAREGSRLLQLQLTDSLDVAKSAEQDVSRLTQDVKRLEQKLAGSQAAAAQKVQKLATQVQSGNVHTRSNCAFGTLGLDKNAFQSCNMCCRQQQFA